MVRDSGNKNVSAVDRTRRQAGLITYQRIRYEDRHSGKSASNSLESLERKSGISHTGGQWAMKSSTLNGSGLV